MNSNYDSRAGQIHQFMNNYYVFHFARKASCGATVSTKIVVLRMRTNNRDVEV